MFTMLPHCSCFLCHWSQIARVHNMLLEWFTCIALFIVWHIEVVFPFGEFLDDLLGTCSHMFMTKMSIMLCRSAWLWQLLPSSWSLPSLSLAFVRIKRNSACASKLLFKPVVPFDSTIPTYMWYLAATPNLDFLVPSRNLFKSFPFATVQAHGAVRENQYLPCQKYFDGSFN